MKVLVLVGATRFPEFPPAIGWLGLGAAIVLLRKPSATKAPVTSVIIRGLNVILFMSQLQSLHFKLHGRGLLNSIEGPGTALEGPETAFFERRKDFLPPLRTFLSGGWDHWLAWEGWCGFGAQVSPRGLIGVVIECAMAKCQFLV